MHQNLRTANLHGCCAKAESSIRSQSWRRQLFLCTWKVPSDSSNKLARHYSHGFPLLGAQTRTLLENQGWNQFIQPMQLSPISPMGSALWCTLGSQTTSPVSGCLSVPQDQGLRHPNSEKKVFLSTTGPERLHFFQQTASKFWIPQLYQL